MTNNELLQADLLDILFEGRNKEYGAYALRRNYNKRLLFSLAIGMLLISLFILMNSFNRKNDVTISRLVSEDSVVVITIDDPDPKPIEVLKTKIIDPPPSIKSVAPLIVPDVEVPETQVPTDEDQEGKIISDITTAGTGNADRIIPPTKGAGADGIAQPDNPDMNREPLPSSNPEFPGGIEALRKFLGRNLQTPEELAEGSTKTVRAKFHVDKEGVVSLVEIETSAGVLYDQEVIRVCKKMPRWKPAIQNGEPVSMSYVLPVTFITQ